VATPSFNVPAVVVGLTLNSDNATGVITIALNNITGPQVNINTTAASVMSVTIGTQITLTS
jgi:hypothetical protein